MNPNNRLTDLIVIANRLVAQLEIENDALRSHKTELIHTLLDEKATLARVYESRFKVLAEKPELLDEAEPKLREQLKSLAEKVDRLIHDNGDLLNVTIEANRRVVDLIAEAVHAQQPNAGTYSSDAQASTHGANAASQRVALSLDETL